MDRYLKANASTIAPAVPATSAGGYPQDGKPASGIDGSIPGAWWFHSITEELRNAIIAAGLTPDYTKTDQLSQVIACALSFVNTGSGALSRPSIDKQRETLDLNDYDTFMNAANESVRSGRHVRLPGRNLNVPANTVIPGGAVFRGVEGKTQITIIGNGSLIHGGNGIRFTGVTFKGGTYAVDTSGTSRARYQYCTFSGQRSHGVYCDGDGHVFDRNEFSGCGGSGLAFVGVTAALNEAAGNVFDRCANFGIWNAQGANRNLMSGNRTIGNGLELIGVTSDSWGHRIISNHASGTGDNGISVSGYRCTVTGNICENNANHGLGLYGERNAVTSNVCRNNGQRNVATPGGAYAGITCTPAFGGLARKNVLTCNICDDDQASTTQFYGVKVTTNSHVQWTAGTTVTVANLVRFNGLNLYRTSKQGTTGSTPPTHSSGTVSDGSIEWTWIASNLRTPALAYPDWSASTNVNGGVLRFSGNCLYQATTDGKTGSTAPAHKSGAASDGGVSWLFVEEYPTNLDGWDNVIGHNTASGNLKAPWAILTGNKNNVYEDGTLRLGLSGRNITSNVVVLPGSPEGSPDIGVAEPGTLGLRRDASTTPGIALMSKQSGSGATGWLPVALRHQGPLSSRPDLSSLGNGARGYLFFATDQGAHGTLLIWHGTGYLDLASGATFPAA
ncbi:right-handed parallel beta-helix repeat-containing protein [Caballeronia glebae]|uniref:Right handed beta helix domain-containing protein n=1 Tax=Caballeronia glebae TaxID=1777143 RepID=A0A158DCG8_9BURK|nr:right-handed parallel beta-helix repeat-containing protein [Caballeronia glebae]SAK92191.1 hypothetical protein AWB82_06579 [Caballeronia glebae]